MYCMLAFCSVNSPCSIFSLSRLRLRRLPRRKIVIFRSRHRLKLGESSRTRGVPRSLSRFGQEPALHGKRAGGFIFDHHRCDRLFTDRPKALDRALCCLSAAQKEQVDAQTARGTATTHRRSS